MVRELSSATEEELLPFSAENEEQIQRMINLAHCVSAYERHSEPYEWFEHNLPVVQTGRLAGVPTQDVWDVLFLTCRNDRHGGDGSVYREPWFVDACNEIRSRLIKSSDTDMSQEQLLNQPVLIPHRTLKDPREIRMLDPACGSMHFGLYAFDLYLSFYDEFWDLVSADSSVKVEPSELAPLTELYESKEAFLCDVPRLIIEHNIHGVDIDPRAVQIAGLSLWMRAQRAWNSQGLAAKDRPQVERSNVVCAEPMPGDKEQLEDFCKTLHPAIAQMVEAIFEEMKLAGEAGSLLKIEEEVKSLVAKAKTQFLENPPDRKTQRLLFGHTNAVVPKQLTFDLSGITDEQFFRESRGRDL